MNNTVNGVEGIGFKDTAEMYHGLKGHVKILRKNKKTGEVSLWYENDNVITLSGYQWILMKMFGLFLDSNHGKDHVGDNLSQDSTIAVPDLNNGDQMKIGVNPDNYTSMDENISSNHFIQGFMIGSGGSGEDAITAKNTNYSFIKLRNPIPFRQATKSNPLTSDVAGKYLGIYRNESNNDNTVQSFYIKKFDDTPHIYHSWWKDGNKWDYVDPVTVDDLGPDAVNGTGKTNRIETYAECHMTLDEDDCTSYFSHDGNNSTAQVNELGLVAFDTIPGVLSILEKLYSTHIKDIIKIIFNNNRTTSDVTRLISLSKAADIVLKENLTNTTQTNIAAFMTQISDISVSDESSINFDNLQSALSSDTNIGVEALYNSNGMFMYESDNYLKYVSEAAFSITDTDKRITDEAQRIKLITYYTFNALPVESDWETLIYYRIYAN